MRTEYAPSDAKLYNNVAWGPMQGTGGSSAIANSFLQYRGAGATARAMLVAAAAAAGVFVGVGILATAGITLNALLRALERRLAPWRHDLRP